MPDNAQINLGGAYDVEGSRAKAALLKSDPIIIEMATELMSMSKDEPKKSPNALMLFAVITYNERGGKIKIGKHIAAPIDAISALMSEAKGAANE